MAPEVYLRQEIEHIARRHGWPRKYHQVCPLQLSSSLFTSSSSWSAGSLYHICFFNPFFSVVMLVERNNSLSIDFQASSSQQGSKLLFSKMCILFLYTKPTVEDGEYRVILASNRDENYTRPAQPLATWIDNPVIMGGRDMEPGKEGGTWLAMSLHGRISILLNILQGKSPLNKGHLIRHYPDPFLDQAAPHMSAELREKMSSIFVRVPEKHFGTSSGTTHLMYSILLDTLNIACGKNVNYLKNGAGDQ
uniref:Uncharacterized protein n=1 Tax=Timema poppense TaxID=170557 RepID=A0A7R9CNT3_TIMPO|nr:unnamed protein product [Timema poppensis]